jgi:N-acyl-L-homoserine lactone synthetase
MYQVLHATPRGIPDHVLRAMFVARKRVFVDLLKWDVPVLDGRFEIDQFDDDRAIYLVLADHDGGHLGSARLLPTTQPHILGGLFPELCEDDPPRGHDIYEITRFCLDRSLNAHDRRIVRNTLVNAIVNHALDHGIRSYTAIAEMGWFQQILAFGWTCAPLGLPHAHKGALIAALAIKIDRTTPSLLAQAGIVPMRASLSGDERAAA